MPQLRATVGVIANAATIAAMFAPVPWLSTAATIVTSMIDVCDNVRFNRYATLSLTYVYSPSDSLRRKRVFELYCRCEGLLFALKDRTENVQADHTKMETMIQKSIVYVLICIQHRMLYPDSEKIARRYQARYGQMAKLWVIETFS